MTYNLRDDAARVVQSLGPVNRHFEGKSILLTGALGFLGRHFLEYFSILNESYLKMPCHVTGYDNFIRGKPAWLPDFTGKQGIEIVDRSIVEPLHLERVDYIIHAASIASPVFYRKFPLETMDTNVTGIRNILEFARENRVESILYLSSSEIYGDPPAAYIPTPESFGGMVSSTGPRACYDESKRYGETLCVNYYRQFSTPVKIVRPFNVYGPGLKPDDGRVMSDLCRDAILNKEIRLLSDGTPTRTFCYISDAIDGFVRVLLSDKEGEVYNIGCDTPEISINDLAARIAGLEGASIVKAKSEDPDYCADNPKRRCPDISKARSQLGYIPRILLDEGLDLTYRYYKSVL